MTTDRRLKILLIVSLAINIFLLGAGITTAVLGARMIHDRMESRGPMMLRASRALPDDEREMLRRMMRERAMIAAPTLRAAREARREAARLIAEPAYDPKAVAAAMARARENESKARALIDEGVVAFLPSLTPERRAALARAFVSGRMGPHGGGGDGRFRGGPPPGGPPRPEAPPSPPSP